MKYLQLLLSYLFILLFSLFLGSCNKVESIKSENIQFEKLQNMKTDRAHHKAITMKNGKVLMTGNWEYNCEYIYDLGYDIFKGTLLYADIYDPETKTFNKLGKTTIEYEVSPSALNLADGRVLLMKHVPGPDLVFMETFNPETFEFKKVENIYINSCFKHVLKNGNLLRITNEHLEIYDPNSWQLINKAALSEKGKCYSVLQDDGNVLLIGGRKIVELYNPETNKINVIGTLKSTIKDYCASYLLKNGTVFLLNYQGRADIYSLKKKEIIVSVKTKTNLYNKGTSFDTIQLLDGRILLYIVKDNHLTVEIFNPKKNKFSVVLTDKVSTKNPELTLLQDGNILVSGGIYIKSFFDFTTGDCPSFEASLLKIKSVSNKPEKKPSDSHKVIDYKTIIEEKNKVNTIKQNSERLKATEKYFVIPPQFDEASDFSEGLASVKMNNKWGFINKQGTFIISPQFYEASSFSEGLASVKTNNGWGYINKKGSFVIPPQFTYASDFSKEMASVNASGKWGLIDRQGKAVVKSKYDNIFRFKDGISVVKLNEKYGLIDKEGNVLCNPQFDDLFPFTEGLALVSKNDGWGFIDAKCNFVIGPKYSEAQVNTEFGSITNFNEGLAWIIVNGKYGYIDKEGKVVIKPQFDNADDFNEGLAAVNIDNKYGYIDKEGDFVIKPRFNYAKEFNDGLASVEVSGKWGYINKKGEIIVVPQFKEALNFYDGIAAVTFGPSSYDYYGYINKKGEMITKSIYRNDYNSSNNYKNGLILVSETRFAGYLDGNGNVIIKPVFDYLRRFHDGLAAALINDKWGYIKNPLPD